MLGAVTDDGDSFYCWTEETLETRHGILLLEALTKEFGEDLVVFLDRAGYFYTRDLWERVSGERATETVSDSLGRVCAWRQACSLVLSAETAGTKPTRRLLGSAERMV